ncbi:LysR family transcriptional regulator [Streptomyces sp. NPDC059095]|uniref:LysR family transcriptional regulator n=1 Tax=Streptomyces sp. NPDC059095 TaxID=3346726 RepID=UPI0036AA4AD0
MQLGWLQTFVSVYRTGSFTKAARDLDITQPAVTQQIRGLESELGRPLFDRTPQGAVPTVEGEALAHDIEESINDLNVAIGRHFSTDASNRPLRLGGPAEVMAVRVMPSIANLITAGMDVRVSLGESSDLLADLKGGHLDIVVSTIRPRCRGIDERPLADEEFVLIASPQVAANLPAGGLAIDGSRALEKVPLISYAESLPIIRGYWQAIFGCAPPASPAVVVPDLRAVIATVTAAAGISVVPSYLCTGEIGTGALVPLLEPEEPPINTFYLATRSGALAEPRLASLHAHLLAHATTWK